MKYVSIIAIILSATALSLALYREFQNPAIIRAPTTKSLKTEKSTQALQDELLILRKRLASLEKKTQLEIKNEPAPIPVLQEQVAELTTFQEDLAEYTLNIDPLDVIGTTEREIEVAYDTLMDESLSPMERAKQAALLKRYDLFDQEAIDSMKNLFLESESASEKTAALVALKGYVSPEIRDGVLEAFSTEVAEGYKNGRFRYHGIEALEPLLPNPEVEAMLTLLAQYDPEPKIAGRAAKSVGLPVNSKEAGLKEVDRPNNSKDGDKRDG